MRKASLAILAMTAIVGLGVGCKKSDIDKSGFKSALNDYYKTQNDCLWSAPVKFPAQADTNNDDQTKGFDALVDGGLLTRGSAEKKRFLVGSKQVNNYDVSDKGRSKWTADQSQPGYGNFCFGHQEVVAVDSFTPPDPDQTQYTVNYRYGISNMPDWATSAEMKTAFPKIVRDGSGALTGTATLTKGANGWVASNVQAGPGSQGGE
jgi:hypothetical protein